MVTMLAGGMAAMSLFACWQWHMRRHEGHKYRQLQLEEEAEFEMDSLDPARPRRRLGLGRTPLLTPPATAQWLCRGAWGGVKEQPEAHGRRKGGPKS